MTLTLDARTLECPRCGVEFDCPADGHCLCPTCGYDEMAVELERVARTHCLECGCPLDPAGECGNCREGGA